MRNDDLPDNQPLDGPGNSGPPDSGLDALKSKLRWAQESQRLAVGILQLLSSRIGAGDAIREILGMVKESTAFEAVGIRLSEGEDFPYFETKGFPPHFVKAENYLCGRTETGEIIRDRCGKPVLECMCGNVICGRTDPSLPFFTAGGSFWSNCTTDLLAATTEEERQTRTRNRCNGEGYESVALMPLRSEDEIIGLLQLNDSRKNCFTPEMIDFFEGVGVSIGIVLEHKRVEQERDRLFDLSIDILCIAGFDGFSKQVNPALTKTLGWTKEEFLSKPWIEFVHPEDRQETLAAAERLKIGERLHEFRNRYRHKGGFYRWISWSVSAIPGKNLFYAVGRDVTEQREFEEDLTNGRAELEKRVEERTTALKETNEKLLSEILERKAVEHSLRSLLDFRQTLIDSIPNPVFYKDVKGKYLGCNEAFATLLGLPRRDIVGKSVYEVVPKDLADIWQEKDQELFDGPYVQAYESNLTRPDGSRRSVVFHKAPFFNADGSLSGLIGVILDITERKRAEEALRESEARVRMKLDAILRPEGDISALELADVIDKETIQPLMDDFFSLTKIPVGIIDLDGRILVATGWQDICTKFHRKHPETRSYCIESDTLLSRRVEQGSSKLYRCKNSMWDIATPIVVGGKHLGNIFLGQFLFEDEVPDYEFFRSQAHKYGFDEKQYLEALEKVPRWSQETVDAIITFYTKLADILSTLGYSNIKLARSLAERERLVNSLQDSEKRYRSLFENMLDGFAYHKMIFENGKPQDYVFLSVNDSFERLTGLKNVVGKKVTEVIPGIKESDQELFDIYGRVALTGNPERFEAYVGSLGMWFSISVYSSEREHFVTVFDNITERKQGEEQVKQAKEFLNTVVDNLPVPVFAKSAQDGQFILWNKASEMLFGYHKDQVIGKTDYDFFPNEQADFFWEKDRESFASGEVIDIPEEPILTKSLGTRILHTRKVPVYDKNRQPSYLLGISQDITERKEFEDSLRDLSNFQQTMIDAMPNPVFYKDGNGKYLGCNESFATLLGLSKEQVVGRSAYEVVSREAADIWNEKDQEVLNRPHVQSYDFNFRASDGTERFFINRKAPFFTVDGSVAGLVGVMMDITDRKRAEEALRESEERYRDLVEESFDGLFIQKGTKLVFTNSRLRAMLGYQEGELEGQEHWVVYHPDYRDITRDRAQARLRGEPVVSRYEVKLQRKDGSSFDCELLAKPVQVEGEPGIQAWFRDITERKHAEDALRESEEKYRASFNNAAVGIDLVDRDGRFLEVNETLSDFLGYTPEEFKNLTIFDVTHPKDVAKTTDLYREFVQGENKGYRLEKRYLRKNGEIVWGDTSVSAIQGRAGEYLATVGVIADITKRRQSEETARRLATAVEQAAEAIVITDTEGTITYVNPAFERTTGHLREETIGKNPSILKSGQHSPEFYRSMWETLHDGRVWSGRLISKKKDGTLFEEEATVSPIKDDSGAVVSYVGVKRDVTKEVSLQKQLVQAQKMEAIGTLAGGIAHDFNNLLQVTLGYSELLLSERVENDPDYGDLQKIQHAALSGADLVQRLLTFSRKVEPKPVPMSLNKRINHVEKLLSRTIPKMIDIRLELGLDTQRISADPALVEQVLMNLALNARDAMPDGGVLTISTANVTLDEHYCELHPGAKPGSYVMLSVSDTGHGMDNGTIEHVFEPFYTTKELGRGTGLGLAMVYGIVKQHGGYITCESSLGTGAAFKIYLPAIPTEAEPDTPTDVATIPSGSETILLVDDEEIIRDLGKKILERSGYKVLTAANGKEALKLYGEQKGEISLVILDLIMPEMGGKQCLEELLKINPKVKILIASGYSADGPNEEAFEIRARGFVAKPYNLKEMLQIVRKVLDES